MDTVDELNSETTEEGAADVAGVQSAVYLLELSLDWIVLRASENIHRLLGESHVTLIDEPLGKFVQSQALHDLRNLFSRLSGTTGIGRAYAVRLTDDNDLVDVAFQLADGRVLLEMVPSADCFGECFGTVGGLVAGLSSAQGQSLLDAGARRMRALTGYDRVTLVCGNHRAESSRGPFAASADMTVELPLIIADVEAVPVPVFPRDAEESSTDAALLSSVAATGLNQLRREGVRSSLRIPFSVDDISGEFRCDCRAAREPSFEMHGAAELFAQLFAMRLEIDRFKNG